MTAIDGANRDEWPSQDLDLGAVARAAFNAFARNRVLEDWSNYIRLFGYPGQAFDLAEESDSFRWLVFDFLNEHAPGVDDVDRDFYLDTQGAE